MKLSHTTLAAAIAAAMALSAPALAATSGAPTMATSDTATNWFGGPIYHGEPALDVTAALVKAGGGADDFKFSTALVAMLGEKTVNAEVAKLTKQYGKEDVDGFINGMTFAIKDGLKRATEAGVKLPPPADLEGKALAKALEAAGIVQSNPALAPTADTALRSGGFQDRDAPPIMDVPAGEPPAALPPPEADPAATAAVPEPAL